MKLLFASALILVGSCSTLRHSERIENLKKMGAKASKQLPSKLNDYEEDID